MPEIVQYPMKSFDQYAGQNTDEQLDQLWADGYQAAIHYYGGSTGKRLSPSSARQLTQKGFMIGAVFESGGNVLDYFTVDQGNYDSNSAINQANWVKQPQGSAIYFAVDVGVAHPEDLLPYFQAVSPVVRAAGFKVGAYGCGLLQTGLFNAKLIDYDWLAGAGGWPGSRAYISPFDPSGKPAITQGLEKVIDGIDMDPDMVYREAGLFQVVL